MPKVSIPWYSWIILAFHLAWTFGLLLMTRGESVSPAIRWVTTISFAVLALAFGLYDFVIKSSGEGLDDTAFDRWTIVHTLAGVTLGVWFIPLVYVLITVIWWECFEYSVKGFGDREVITNRLVDIGVALVGWTAAVALAIAVGHAAFPLASPVAN